jgi:sugar (pentulose or hexulose) kinase
VGEHLLVFDVGTTAVKTVLFSREGKVVGKGYCEYPTRSPAPGLSEQDPREWWRALVNSCREALRGGGSPLAVGLTTQRATVFPADREGNPLHPALTWMDTRSSPSLAPLEKRFPMRLVAHRLVWFRESLPEVFARAHLFLTVDAYLTGRLTGNFVSDPVNSSYSLLDTRRVEWSGELSEAFGIPLDRLPPVRPPGTVAGELLPGPARELNLPPGLPVVVGGGDQQCSALGLGAVEPGIVKATTGTGTFVDAVVEEPLLDFYEPSCRMFCLPHAVPGKWCLEAVMPGTGQIYRWFRDELSQKEREEGRRLGLDPYELLNREAEKAEPGCRGLLVIPLFSYSRGLFLNLSFSHTRAHLIRAILESNGYTIRLFLDLMESLGVPVSELRVDGGGARSPLWRQIQADITGKPVVLTEVVEDASSLGAALLAGRSAGVYRSLEEAVRETVRVVERREPREESRRVYEELYPKYQETLIGLASELGL